MILVADGDIDVSVCKTKSSSSKQQSPEIVADIDGCKHAAFFTTTNVVIALLAMVRMSFSGQHILH